LKESYPFFQEALKKFQPERKINFEEFSKSSKFEYINDLDESVLTVRIDEDFELSCSPKKRLIYYYSTFDEDPAPEDTPFEDGVSEEEVLAIANRIWADLDVDVNDQYAFLSRSRTIGYSSWLVRSHYKHNEYPCELKGTSIQLSAYTGKLQMFLYRPVIPPDSLEVKISRKKALKKASKYKKTLPELERYFPTKFADLEIIHPPDVLMDRNNYVSARLPYTHLCWVIRFPSRASHHDPSALVYIDAETGEPRGGYVP
jgi:hypothetical protein